jgi:hypothetical protein
LSHVSFSWWGVLDAPSEQHADVAVEAPPDWAEPATEWIRVVKPTPVTEAEHQAALAEIDLPPYPLELAPSPLRVLGSWAAATLQIALGATIGAMVVIVALAWIVQASR